VKQSEKDHRPFRENYAAMIEQYVGSEYHKGEIVTGNRPEILTNLMHQTANIYTQNLVANNPRVLISTKHQHLRPFAMRFQQAVNDLAIEINLRSTIRLCVLDAFFLMGIVKVFNGESAKILFGSDNSVDPGQPYAERISPHDFLFDSLATQWRKVGWVRHTYYVNKDALRDSDIYNQKIARKLSPTTNRGSDHQENRADGLSRDAEENRSEFQPHYRMDEFWIPGSRLVVTYADGDFSKDPIGYSPYNGTEHGPYHILAFSDTPESIYPVAPAMNMLPLHNAINSLKRKSMRQANAQKNVFAYMPSAVKDAENIRNTEDGMMCKVSNIKGVQLFNIGGVDQQNWAFTKSVEEDFNNIAGNPRTMGGLGASEGTLGQERIVQQNISNQESSRQSRVAELTAKIFTDLGMLLWNDQHKTMNMTVEFEDMQLSDKWTPEEREGDFVQYNFTSDPYDMRYRTPTERADDVLGILERVILPGMQMIQQQGGTVDYQELLTEQGELRQLPRLANILKWNAPPEVERPEASGGGPEQRQAANTTRTHIRQNVPPDPNNASAIQTQMAAGARDNRNGQQQAMSP
jgi:hypothetical protein